MVRNGGRDAGGYSEIYIRDSKKRNRDFGVSEVQKSISGALFIWAAEEFCTEKNVKLGHKKLNLCKINEKEFEIL